MNHNLEKFSGNMVLSPTATFEYGEVRTEQSYTATELAAVKTFLAAINTLYGVLGGLKTIKILPEDINDTAPNSNL